MEFTLKGITLATALVLTGLSAGLFYAWEVSVIPGTRRLDDTTYLHTMQSINRAIINPRFMIIFLGALLSQLLSTYIHWGQSGLGWMVAATLAYALGTLLVTGMGNVPLNNGLEALSLDILSLEEMATHRAQYELRWNRLHTIRTVFSVLSFILLLVGVLHSVSSFAPQTHS